MINIRPAELGMGIHAGVEETSVMLHLRPDLVKLELGQRSVPEHLALAEIAAFDPRPPR